jgi:transposase InsO family protein
MPMPKDLPSSLQQHGRCYRSAFYIRKHQLPSGHTNAVAESFFATYKKELIHTRPWNDLADVRQHTFLWIEIYYNRRRRHSTLNYLTPLEYELGYRNLTDLAA